jgi:hypothetical protein
VILGAKFTVLVKLLHEVIHQVKFGGVGENYLPLPLITHVPSGPFFPFFPIFDCFFPDAPSMLVVFTRPGRALLTPAPLPVRARVDSAPPRLVRSLPLCPRRPHA